MVLMVVVVVRSSGKGKNIIKKMSSFTIPLRVSPRIDLLLDTNFEAIADHQRRQHSNIHLHRPGKCLHQHFVRTPYRNILGDQQEYKPRKLEEFLKKLLCQ